MTSRDDDTMPLPGLSQELSSDITADEDFIPTSQPQSTVSSKVSKNSDTSFKSSEELADLNAASTLKIDDMFPRESVSTNSASIENDKSADFIPDTVKKEAKISPVSQDLTCKKKLAVFSPGESFENHPIWDDADVSQIPESPALDTQDFSILKETPTKTPPLNPGTVKTNEESVTEIMVNDSGETVDLEMTPVMIKKLERGKTGENLDTCNNSEGEKCEKTQVFDNSSVLLLDQPGSSRSGLENNEKLTGTPSVKSYLQETVDDNKENSQDRANGFNLQTNPALAAADFSKKPDSPKLEAIEGVKINQNEVQCKPTSMEPSNTSIAVKKIDFKLTVSCRISFNPVTNKILHKAILNVSETPKSKPKPASIDHAFDNASDKSKRHSTSSSGSVYSDKTGLPFALPKRLSVVSDQTDSSEEDFNVQVKRERRKLERTPWSNEYLLPLKMDDMMQFAIEKEDFLKKPVMSSPRKPKSKDCNGVNQLKEILESSSSSRTSLCDTQSSETQQTRTSNTEDTLKAGTSENSATETPKAVEKANETDASIVEGENVQFGDKQEQSTNERELDGEANLENSHESQTPQKASVEEEITSVALSDGLPVFARWTDKRYYSGVLVGNVKNDRWDVKFDDGTWKTMREDFIMPVDWLKVGALVFALVEDKYESGQISNINRGKEVNYAVELDIRKKEVNVKISDLCLTDVMAGIVREKYKPLSETPKGGADIDFDNVLSGKRVREQRTPLRPPIPAPNSGLKKKSSKTKKDKGYSLESIKETPQNKGTEGKIRGLKSDNCHLVEDKITSADSPSETDTRETPLRGSYKETRRKAKPRNLSYESEEIHPESDKHWLAPDGTPIPGPSGVKTKKQKTKKKADEENHLGREIESPVTRSSKKSPARSKAPKSSEKSRRKRKLDEFGDDSLRKRSLREGSSKMKTRSRKG